MLSSEAWKKFSIFNFFFFEIDCFYDGEDEEEEEEGDEFDMMYGTVCVCVSWDYNGFFGGGGV